MRRLASRHVPYPRGRRSVAVPRSDGTIEAAGLDVMHFTQQSAFLTGIPSVYTPHDLQHVHFPRNFSRRERARREVLYEEFSRRAAFVQALTSFGRDDLVRHLGLRRDRVVVVPWAPVLAASAVPPPEVRAATRRSLRLEGRFLLYPAQTWPHKRHQDAIEALAILRAEGETDLTLVLTGKRTDHAAGLDGRIRRLGLDGQVRWTGYLPDRELLALYVDAAALVFPSEFEGWGLPIIDALALGTPVVAAAAACVPEVSGGAAQLFPVRDAAAFAVAIKRVLDDDSLRASMTARGRAHAANFSWQATAAALSDVYREAHTSTR